MSGAWIDLSPGTHFGEVNSNWLNPVSPGQFWCFLGWFFQFFPGFPGFTLGFSVFQGDLDETWRFSPPGKYHPLWPPDLDEGSTTGCLWWSLTGGEVTHMCHTSRGRCEP